MKAFTEVQSKAIAIAVDDIDTDQIIPARFLKTIDKLGLGKSLFADWRYREDGSETPDFVLNRESMSGRSILVAGNNFGCGSSREHAPWALWAWGFRVIISTSFADIFRNNALKNGLLLVEVSESIHKALLTGDSSDTDAVLRVNLEEQTLSIGDNNTISFEIDAFSKKCLLEGLDQLSYLLSFQESIEKYESERPGS